MTAKKAATKPKPPRTDWKKRVGELEEELDVARSELDRLEDLNVKLQAANTDLQSQLDWYKARSH